MEMGDPMKDAAIEKLERVGGELAALLKEHEDEVHGGGPCLGRRTGMVLVLMSALGLLSTEGMNEMVDQLTPLSIMAALGIPLNREAAKTSWFDENQELDDVR